MRRVTSYVFILIASIFAHALWVPSVHATLLNLTKTTPDITAISDSISTSYNSTSDKLFIAGLLDVIDFDGIAPPDHVILPSISDPFGNFFKINLFVDGAGVVSTDPGNPDIEFKGAVDYDDSYAIDNGESYSTLLTGEISAFGYSNSKMEFVFNVTGGSLAPQFGSKIGMIFAVGSNIYNGTFTNSFSIGNFSNWDGTGTSDTFPVIPEPASAGFLIAGAIGAVVLRSVRKKRNNSCSLQNG